VDAPAQKLYNPRYFDNNVLFEFRKPPNQMCNIRPDATLNGYVKSICPCVKPLEAMKDGLYLTMFECVFRLTGILFPEVRGMTGKNKGQYPIPILFAFFLVRFINKP
jgi:hypothetical protein